MKLKAYAKINLGLRILQKRPDGYHDIETVFYPIDQADLLEMEAASSDIRLFVSSPQIPSDQSNLCWKAASALREMLGISRGVTIRLTKNVPPGGGLGGGSSDAAAVLRALPVLWNIEVPSAVLQDTACLLGSDVPFFLQNSPAYARGRGEILSPLSIKIPYWIVTVTPSVHVATSWAYGTLAEFRRNKNYFSDNKYIFESLVKKTDFDPIDLLSNDFEEIVFPSFPAIQNLKKEFFIIGAAGAQMSGTGSSVYGFFKEERKAIEAKEYMRSKGIVSFTAPGFQVR